MEWHGWLSEQALFVVFTICRKAIGLVRGGVAVVVLDLVTPMLTVVVRLWRHPWYRFW